MYIASDVSTPMPSSTRPIRPVPLNVGGPIDPEHLVGRETELARIFDAFASVGVVLTGERRLGKTSLARLVERRARQRGWDVVRQSAEGFTTLTDFSAALVSRLEDASPPLRRAADSIRQRWTFKAPGVQIGPASAPRLLEDLVSSAVRASGKRLLLILDELPVLARALERADPGAGIAMLHVLRRQRQEHPERLRMLCLGSIGFHHAVRAEGRGALNDLDFQRLDALSQRDATYLAACIFRHARAPREYERVLAPIIADHVEGMPYYVHQLVASVLRDHPAVCHERDVADVVHAALADPDDPWDLRHYVDRIEPYYGAESPLARAVLDVIASEPSGLSLADVIAQIAVDRRLAPIDDERIRDVVHRLESDHYLARAGDRRCFAFVLVRRAWVAHRS
jgi:hypothetical protein